MTTQTIIRKFNAKGISITKSISTGNVVAGNKVFSSYSAAYKYYFK